MTTVPATAPPSGPPAVPAPPGQQQGGLPPLNLRRMVRGPAIAGVIVSVLFLGGFTTWSTMAPLSSAAVASGVVSPDGSRRTVQHLEGGIIQEILVRDGDRVEAGQRLVVLEDVAARSERDMRESRFYSLAAVEARLVAELNQAETIEFPLELIVASQSDWDLAAALADQRIHFETRAAGFANRTGILEARIAALREEVSGLEVQIASQERQLSLIDEEIAGVQQLVDQGLERRPRLLALQRQQAEIDGSIGANRAAIARAEQVIGETRLQILDLESNLREEVAGSLANLRAEIATIEEELRAREDVLARTLVSAPVSGTVVGLQFHTVGGVVRSGDPILDIVPDDDELIIDARLTPTDIDSVTPGQSAEVHLLAYAQRNMPRLTGTVRDVSADRLVDEVTGEPYFRARVEVEQEALLDLGEEIVLTPGMPVEVMIATGEQTVLDYVVGPLVRSFNRAFREQ